MNQDFHNPDWELLYPLNSKVMPVGLLSPRMACKLFYDALFILEQGEKNPKFLLDRLPAVLGKFFKKKQWRKQYIEAGHRVACRLAKGKGFAANCIAEG